MTPTRRDVLALALAAGACSAGGGMARAGAAARPVPFGAAVYLPDLEADARLGAAVSAYCQRVTPVSELKWATSRPGPDAFDFSAGDRIADFARANGLAMHGHTLVWHAGLPGWVNALSGAAEAEKALATHIETTMARYRDVARSWDVVNEPIPDVARRPTDRRDSPWRALLGDGYIERAFRLAHAVDPEAQLVINEYDIEHATDTSRGRRGAFAHLLRELVEKDVPVHAVGLQAHLYGGVPIDGDGLAAFVAEMRGLGLKVLVTELDVIDTALPAPAGERDALAARQVEAFLEAATASGPLDSITTWGLTDRFTWIKWAYERADGAASRPLPLDEDYRPKPMLDVIERFRRVA